jgi:hypothetical protein
VAHRHPRRVRQRGAELTSPATTEPNTAEAAGTPASAVSRARRRALGVVVFVVLLAAMVAASVAFGVKDLPLAEVWRGLLAHDTTEASVIVWDSRIPRTVVGLITGASFGVADDARSRGRRHRGRAERHLELSHAH